MGNMHTRGYEGTKKVVNVVVGNRRDVRGILPLCAEVPRARAAGVPGACAPAVMGQLMSSYTVYRYSLSVLVGWIRIRIWEGRKTHKKRKKGRNSMV